MPVRFDKAELKKPQRLASGWLMADAYLTRTGIFTYQNSDGSVRRELRLPDEVFAPAAMASFAMVPLTNDHPPVELDSTNTKQYQVGHLGESVRRDGNFVAAKLLFTDAATIADIDGGKVELSCGYNCDLEMTPGSIEGLPYDAIQRNIRGNHVAVVDKGRAGPQAKIKLDSADAFMIGVEGLAKEGPKKMDVVINGKTYQVSPELGAELEALVKEETGAVTDPGDGKTAAPPAVPKGDTRAALKLQLDRALAERDAALADKSKEATAKQDAATREAIRSEVKARLALEETARKLGVKAKLDGQTDRQIREAVISHLDKGAKLDGVTDTYVQVRFDLAVQAAAEETIAGVREGQDNADAAQGQPVNLDTVRSDAHKRTIDRGRAPLKIGTTKGQG